MTLKPCHRHRLISTLAFSIMLPLLGIIVEQGIESMERYNYRNAPIEKFYSIEDVVAHDVDLSEGETVTIEIHRKASEDYTSTRYRSLMKIGLQSIRPDSTDPQLPSYDLIIDTDVKETFLEVGEKIILVEENLADLFGGKEKIREGQYYWVLQYEIHFPYGIERTISKNSNRFFVKK